MLKSNKILFVVIKSRSISFNFEKEDRATVSVEEFKESYGNEQEQEDRHHLIKCYQKGVIRTPTPLYSYDIIVISVFLGASPINRVHEKKKHQEYVPFKEYTCFHMLFLIFDIRDLILAPDRPINRTTSKVYLISAENIKEADRLLAGTQQYIYNEVDKLKHSCMQFSSILTH